MNIPSTKAPVKRVVAYIDVDDTLIRSVGQKRIPIPSVVAYVRRLHGEGAELYCWSSGGADYAREVAREMGVGECFVAFLPKPTVIVDDRLSRIGGVVLSCIQGIVDIGAVSELNAAGHGPRAGRLNFFGR